MKTTPEIPKHYTLSDISRSLKSVIEKNYKGKYWVKAEIAKLNFYPRSGHCYPDLVEKADGKIKVQMRSTIWRSTYKALQRKFIHYTQEELREGLNVLFLVEVKYDGLHGLSLNILDIDPALTMGEMAKERLETIARLKEEGIFDNNKQLPFPLLPKRMAIISVSTSKGYNDFMNIIEPARQRYNLTLKLFPSLLQGDEAVRSIVASLRKIEEEKENFDIILLIRGGGGDVGLQVYNNYELAKAVALAPLPVLTGIGHATNETVTDMVAHHNKITPTDLGYFIVDIFEQFDNKLKEFREKIAGLSREILLLEKEKIQMLKERFSNASVFILHQRILTLDDIRKKIPFLVQSIIKDNQQNLKFFKDKIKILSPENVLKRGYSITRYNGKAVKDANEIPDGETIETQVYKGKIFSIKTKNQ